MTTPETEGQHESTQDSQLKAVIAAIKAKQKKVGIPGLHGTNVDPRRNEVRRNGS